MKYIRSIPFFILMMLFAPDLVDMFFKYNTLLSTVPYAQTLNELTLKVVFQAIMIGWIISHFIHSESVVLFREKAAIKLSHIVEFTYLSFISAFFGLGSLLALTGVLLYFGYPLQSFYASTVPLSATLSLINTSISVCLMVLVAPVVEEYVFRGLVLKKLTAKYSLRVSVIISSALFALFHPYPVQAFLFALLAANVYLCYKNIKFNIVFHMLTNAPSALLNLIPTSDAASNVLSTSLTLQLQLIGFGMILTLISGGLSIHYLIKNSKIKPTEIE